MKHPNYEAEDRFVREWKEWLERPLRRNASDAAARISAEIQRQVPVRRTPRLAFAAAAAALVFVAGISVFLVFRGPQEVPKRAVIAGASQPLGSGEALIWLDERTPLYMTFQPPGVSSGSGEKR
jgi:hypothetical protein